MAIKFYCSCGKHLRARDEMAGRRSQCPRCGQPVGIPALAPTHPGTPALPLTEEEARKRHGSTAVAAVGENVGILANSATGIANAVVPKRRRTRREIAALEQRWYECLFFPLYGAELILGIALAMTALTGIGALVMPDLRESNEPTGWVWLVLWVGPFLALGYWCGFLHCAFASAAAGETGVVRWPGLDLRLLARALVRWFVSFLAGPVVFAAAAFLFWIYGGDPTVVDWLILAELILIGAGHWLLTLVAVQQSDRLRDANPLRVGDLVRRLGYGAVLAMLGALVVNLLLGVLIISALETVHEEPFQGLAFLFLGWLGTLTWLTFLFRLLGIWCFQSRVDAAT
ncbi:MAG: hypothetical protein L0Y72_29200 [Gemmataceae bacterium]|nr:hypothetical protein [Gemmataceae bacterium]MCI0743125.1 hypothetical protein [Gemmataceae bacterium]